MKLCVEKLVNNMKKILTICLVSIILLCGCNKKETKNEEQMPNNVVVLSLKLDTLSKSGAIFILKNGTEEECFYGDDYYLEKQEDGSWKRLNTLTGEPLTWTMIARLLKPGEQKEIKIDWKDGYGELKSGIYRILKEATKGEGESSKKLRLYSEFTIK